MGSNTIFNTSQTKILVPNCAVLGFEPRELNPISL